jgi:uncharacterized OB-fold protein
MFKWFGRVNVTPYTRVSEFAAQLKDGRIMGSRCRACGERSFPPRADCAACMGREFEWIEISGRCTLHTFTRIVAAPTGFESFAPYTVGVVDLEEGGRALAWFGDTIDEGDIAIGMELQLVPQIDEDREEIQVFYSLERPGTTWTKVQSGAAAARQESHASPEALESR